MQSISLTRALAPASVMLLRLLVSAALLSLTATAWSQSATGGSQTASPGSGTSGRTDGQRIAEEEREMIEDLAHANLAEVETGRLAMEKSQNTKVRTFAQQMVDDHQKAYQELQQLGQKKQMTVPNETDFQHKAIAAALRLLSGELFDKQYIRQVGINDHRRTVDLLQKIQLSSQDAELKAHAAKQIPIVQRHLQMAREMDRQMK